MSTDPFPSDALAANRSGHLTPDQTVLYRQEAASDRRNALFAGLAVIVFGAMVLVAGVTGRAPGSPLETMIVGIILVVVGVVVAYSAGIAGSRAKAAAVAAGGVTMLEGPFGRDRRDRRDAFDEGAGHYAPGQEYEYYLLVGDRRFTVSEDQWQVAPEDGIVRVYLLGDSDRIVNLEKVGEAPPRQIPRIVRAALEHAADSPDPGRSAEARAMLRQAEMMAGGAAGGPAGVATGPAAVVVPGSPVVPLGEAILGAWQSDLMRVKYEFRPGGVAVATPAKGESREQPWSVDAAGMLRLDDHVLQATVDGDELSMGEPPRFVVFRRVH